MNKSSSKNLIRLIIVAVLVIAAIMFTFVAIPKLYKKEEATFTVVMLRQNVPTGTLIEENMLISSEIGSYGINGSVIKDKNEIVGKYALQPISSKDLLFPEKFSDTAPNNLEAEKDIDIPIDNTQMLLTLELSSTAAGAAGKILPGDVVNTGVYTLSNSRGNIKEREEYTDDEGNVYLQDAVIFPPELQGLTVYRVQTVQLLPVKSDAEVSSQATNARIPVYITLVVTQQQADLLLEYNYSNIVHFIETNTAAAR